MCPLAPLTLTLSPRRGGLYSFSLSGEGWDEGELFVKVPTGTPHPALSPRRGELYSFSSSSPIIK